MRIREAAIQDAPRIADIYNDAVLNSTASFDLEPKSVEEREQWLEARSASHPVLVAEHDGEIIGWGALSPYSDRAAYAATAEVSVYIDRAFRRRGVGQALTEALIERARSAELHVLLARICSENSASIEMVRKLGFSDAGTMHEVGRKFGRWLDVVTWEYVIRE